MAVIVTQQDEPAVKAEVGEHYLRTTTMDWYTKTEDGWGNPDVNLIGITGKVTGPVLVGNGSPFGGINESNYFRKDTYDWYKKINGQWTIITNLINETDPNTIPIFGGDGQPVLINNIYPSINIGENGNHYLNLTNLEWFNKINGQWELIENLIGLTGYQSGLVTVNQQIPIGGANNSHFLKIDEYKWYKKVNNEWSLVIDLTNQIRRLVTGHNKKVLIGLINPNNLLGNNEDHYLNTVTLDWYTKINDQWGVPISLIQELVGITINNNILVKSGVPNNSIGLDNYNYFDVSTYNWYTKSNNEWNLITNLRIYLGLPELVMSIPQLLVFGLPIFDFETQPEDLNYLMIDLFETF